MGARPGFDSRELEYQYRRNIPADNLGREFRANNQKYVCTGMWLGPNDLVPEGKFPLLKNARVYQPGALRSRPGQTALAGGAFDQLNVHSIKMLDDKIAAVTARIAGAGTKLYLAETGTPAIDTGYSGDPLSMVQYQPDNSPQPWLYLADRSRMRKVKSDGTNYAIGIAPPLASPSAVLGTPNLSILEDFDAVGAWTVGGTAGAISTPARVATTIAAIVYDTGAAGWAGLSPVSMDQMGIGGVIKINSGGGTAESVRIAATFKALAATTIASIAYDAGATGLCTITPGVAVVSWDPSNGGVRPTRPPRDQQPTDQASLGLYPDALIALGGTAENVRVLSVTTGPDGTASFRCSTVNNHVAGNTVTGIASVRAYFANTHAAAETVTTNSFESTVTTGVGWVQKVSAYDLSKIGARPSQPEDEIHISVKIDNLENFVQGTIAFDVDPTTHFSNNYYFTTFRANELVAGVKQTSTMNTVKQIAFQQGFLDPKQFFMYQGLVWPIDQDLTFEEDPQLLEAQDKAIAANQLGTTSDLVNSPVTGTGDSQWFEFRFKISDLQRVGADQSKGLADVTGIRITLQTSASAVCDIDGLWIGGSYGPDVTGGDPFNYRFRYRSKVTGAKSNGSPAMRAGISPHRERVTLTATQSPDPQTDTVDYFRWGGNLPQWLYVGSSPNSATPTFNDESAQVDIVSADTLEFDNYQPFPSVDIPRSGTCNVAGTTVTRVAGDNFNTSWAPGTVINIDGVNYTFYTQPKSATVLEIEQNGSTKAVVNWFITTPVLLGQNLPVLFGPYSNFMFGLGDANQPGMLFWMKGNNADVTSDKNFVFVTPPSEPLMNGLAFDGRAVCASTERWFAVIGSFDGTASFVPQDLPVGHGLFARWGLTRDPNVDQWWFIAKDGIYVTNGGAAQSIVGDLYPIFPHEGQPGVTTNGIVPPDFTNPNNLRLSLAQNHLYFDFIDLNGNRATLVYDTQIKGWISYDVYGKAGVIHYGDEGQNRTGIVIGSTDGKIYQLTGDTDAGSAIAFRAVTPYDDGGDARLTKTLGDGMLDFDSNGQSVTAALFKNWGSTLVGTLGVAQTGRGQAVIDVYSGGLSEVFGFNIGFDIQCNCTLPVYLYGWGTTAIAKAQNTGFRPTDWTDEGYPGAKFFQGFVLEADTENRVKQFYVEDSDGASNKQAFNAQFANQSEQAYSFTAPFIAHHVRLVPSDEILWRLFRVRYIYEPVPELAPSWITQGTTHDIKGFQHLNCAYIALMSTAAVTLTINVDGTDYAYNIASTGGVYQKKYLMLGALKGKLFTYKLTSGSGFRLFQRDCEVRVKGWNDAGPYQVANPFGDVHRIAGARI